MPQLLHRCQIWIRLNRRCSRAMLSSLNVCIRCPRRALDLAAYEILWPYDHARDRPQTALVNLVVDKLWTGLNDDHLSAWMGVNDGATSAIRQIDCVEFLHRISSSKHC